MIYKGSCHCGRIAYEVEGELTEVGSCNCSICRKRGALYWFVPATQMKLLTPRADLASYSFGKKRIQHHFCPVCGCAPFGEGEMGGAPMAAINARCLEDVELEDLPVRKFDGKSL